MPLHPRQILLVAVISFFGGLYAFGRGFRVLNRKRLIENLPTSDVRSIAMGLVEVCGKVHPVGELLSSPLTEAPCVYWSCEVKEHVKRRKNSYWRTIYKGEKGVMFILRDDTGAVLVDPFGGEFELTESLSGSSGIGRDPPLEVSRFLEGNGHDATSFLGFNKTLRYRECRIAPGDDVFILGTAQDNPYVEEATAEKGHHDIMVCCGSSGEVFYISNRSQKDCLNHHFRNVLVKVYGGAVVAIAALSAILWELGLFQD